MADQVKLLNATAGDFPREDLNPEKKKGKEYCLQMARAIVGTYNSLHDHTIGYRSSKRYNEIRKYAQARQPIEPYKRLLEPDIDNDENGFNKLVISDKICPVIPKVRRIVITEIANANTDFDVVFDPIDPLAATELRDEAAELKAKVAMRQALAAAGQQQMANSPSIAKQPGEPDDLEGAEVAVLGMRHKVSMKCELVVAEILKGNQYDNLNEKLAEDWMDFGAAAVKDDTNGCYVTLRHVDMRGLIMSFCTQPDFSDLRYAGEVRNMNLSELIANSDGQVTEAELKEIYKLSQNSTSQVITIPTNIPREWNSIFGYGKVQIFDFEFISTDVDMREDSKDKYGNPKFSKVKGSANTANPKYKSKKVENLYRGKWVMGTSIVYDFGLARNVKFDPKNQSRVKTSYHIIAGDVHDMVAYSRTESLISFADNIQLRRMKLEHAFNTAVPNGHLIDLSALEGIAIDAGGRVMTPRDTYSMYVTRGDLLYRSEDLIGDGRVAPPITPITNEAYGMLEEYWKGIQNEIALMKDSLGLNEVTDGSAPNPKRVKDANAAAINGTKSALADLFSAGRKMILSVSNSVLIRAQDMFKDDKGEAFVAALGSKTVAMLKTAPYIDNYRMGCVIDDRPTPDEVEYSEQNLQLAIQGQQLGADDVTVYRSMKNLKQRNEFLVYKVRKNKEDAQNIAMQQQQQNGQIQQQSSAAAEDEKRKTFEAEFGFKSQLSKQEHLQRMDELTVPVFGKNEDNRIAATGRVDAAYVQGKAKDASSIRQANTKLIETGNENKSEVVNIPAQLRTGIEPLTNSSHPILPGIQQLQDEHFSFLNQGQSSTSSTPAQAPQSQETVPQQNPQEEQAESSAQQNPQEESTEAPQQAPQQQVEQMLNGKS